MRQLVYSVAASLDGFIAGPNGEHDWIVSDPAFDFVALWDRFDTLIMGRRTYEVALTRFHPIENLGKRIFVVSATLHPAQHPPQLSSPAEFPRQSQPSKPNPAKISGSWAEQSCSGLSSMRAWSIALKLWSFL